MDLLWPDLGVDEAAPRLHKAAHYGRKAIGRADAVVLRAEMVSLLPRISVTVDVEGFESAARRALAHGTTAEAAAVLDRYPGEPLPADLYAEWAAEPRERLTGLRLRLLHQARRWHEVLERDPVDEAAHLELMRELAHSGDSRGALRQFETMDHALRRELGTEPGPEATRLRAEVVEALRAVGSMTPTFESWVRDLEAVVDSAGLDRFPLLGVSRAGPVAIVYATRHPDRVSKLVLYGTYVQGRLNRATSEEERRLHRAQVELARLGWGRDDPAFRQVFTSQFMPEASRELWDEFNELQRRTVTADNAARVLEVGASVDVRDEAAVVGVSTLVLHARDDRRAPFEQGRLAASLIPDSRLVALESSNHILLADEPAWPVFLREVEAFLAE